MATICGGSLALFDAGVAVVRPVGGVACGMVSRTKADSDELEDYTILTDILVRLSKACVCIVQHVY